MGLFEFLQKYYEELKNYNSLTPEQKRELAIARQPKIPHDADLRDSLYNRQQQLPQLSGSPENIFVKDPSNSSMDQILNVYNHLKENPGLFNALIQQQLLLEEQKIIEKIKSDRNKVGNRYKEM